MVMKNYFIPIMMIIIVSCSKNEVADNYSHLVRDVLKYDDATSINDKEKRSLRLNALNSYVGTLKGTQNTFKCKVEDIKRRGAGFWDDLIDIGNSINLTERQQDENKFHWDIKCKTGTKRSGYISYNIKLHDNFISEKEWRILKGTSEGDNLAFTGTIKTANRFLTINLRLNFRNMPWSNDNSSGEEEVKKSIFIH